MIADDKTSLPELGDAFAELRPDLLRHCYRMLGSFEEAEDVVQDVLLRAWRARDTYAGDAPLSHWLMRIATNACLNALTRGRTRALTAARARARRGDHADRGAGGGELDDPGAGRAAFSRSGARRGSP